MRALLVATLPWLSLPEIPPPPADWPLVEPLALERAAGLRAAWKPMAGTATVSVVRAGGEAVLELPCRFRGSSAERASWDREIELDLTSYRGLQFHLRAGDLTPISHFTFYLRSGHGWYAVPFAPAGGAAAAAGGTGWCHVEILKSEARIEGAPAGWSRIEAIRFSAWRGLDADTTLHLAHLGLLGGDAPVAIVRGESVAARSPAEARSAMDFAALVSRFLEEAGVPATIVSDLDVAAGRLGKRKIAILPYNPDLPAGAAARLEEVIGGGGGLIAFYLLPRALRDATGIATGNHVRESRPGQFAAMRFVAGTLPGAPPVVEQRSWNIQEARAVEGRSRVAAWWHDAAGRPAGQAAVVVSGNAIFMTHVLLADSPAAKRRLLLAMVGRFAPELWERAAHRRLEAAGRIGSWENLTAARAAVQGLGAAGERSRRLLERAAELWRRGGGAIGEGRYLEALDLADEVQGLVMKAYARAQRPLAGERRLFWCHSAFGVEGMEWDEAVGNLAANGFTGILPNMLWAGTAYYRSQVLPVAPEVAERGDQLAKCLAACRRHGLECHVWKVNWNLSGRAPADFARRLKEEGRTQVRADGTADDRWLCPSHPENQKLEVDSMLEVALEYDVDGIHFDYIRYPGPDHCFCGGCRRRFEEALGREVVPWPQAVRSDPALRERWLEFRRANITRVVAAVAREVRRRRPGVRISAAVFRNWPLDRDGVGQDWKLWCEEGYLDFVCPMDYTESTGEFERFVRLQRGWAGKVACYPGIGLSTWSDPADFARFLEQIAVTRRLGTGGFTVFNYGRLEARTIVPLCGEGVTRRE